MAELFVGPIINRLYSTYIQYVMSEDQFKRERILKVRRLLDDIPMIQDVIDYASSQEQIKGKKSALSKQLRQLRDTFDEVDDLVDEIEYWNLEKRLIKMDKKKKRNVLLETEGVHNLDKTLHNLDKRKLNEIVHKLGEVSAGVKTLLHLVKEAKHMQLQLKFYEALETRSSQTNDIIGRGKEKETVMKWLRNQSNKYQTSNEYRSTFYGNISLLSIVGQGGTGKTIILQHVYKKVMIDEFDLKLWICVSNNFNMKKVIADMLESLTNERPRLETIDALQKNLESMVKTKKFLLVLDDIWEEEDEDLNKSKWEKVLAPLASGKLGSKILVTTRMKSIALMLSKVLNKKNEMLILEGLNDNNCLMLLSRYAFANKENLIVHRDLWSVAREIVTELSGSPLAARVIGGVLNSSLDKTHWNRVLNYVIESKMDILDILKLSYISLPTIFRNCISFCCAFPQDYEFEKDDLIQMWIALRFIQPSSIQGETLKDVGEKYFDFFVKKSLFDKFQTTHGTCYKLPDLLHEMLRVVSGQQCFSIVDDEELQIPDTIRHLFIKTSYLRVLRKVEKLKKLHSIHLSYDENSEDFISVLVKIFKTSRRIRLMYINARVLKQMPKEIGDLKHLRYLRISTNIQMPRSLSNLYHLRFLICNQYFLGGNLRVDDILPNDINNLLNLQYLSVPFPGIHEIGKLISLQELDGFYVQNKSGYGLDELKYMNNLRVLKINSLENVDDAKDAVDAKLCDKSNLIDLSLRWDDRTSDVVPGLNENVLDNLQPHFNLKKLKIYSFMGVRPAIWMNLVDLIFNLEHIDLAFCEGWQTLPPFWQLPCLKYLYLCNMTKVKGFDHTFHGIDKVRVFPSLQVLHIVGLKALEDWFVATATSYECLFPCLTELHLSDCPNLLELPALSAKLEKLEINKIGWKGSNWLQGINSNCSISIEDCPNLISLKGHQQMETTEKSHLMLSELIINDPSLLLKVPLKNITSIQKLEIVNNNEVISFSIDDIEEWFLKVSSSLCELKFKSLTSLQFLPYSLESLYSLEILHVEDIPLLQLMPNMPASLKVLELLHLESLQYLPSSLSFSSLEHLHLEIIPLLQQLPDLPTSLCELQLDNLSNLHCLPSCLSYLFSLKKLCLQLLPQLRELPGLPPSLKTLIIGDCHPELMKCYKRDTGSGWHKIAHIPELYIL